MIKSIVQQNIFVYVEQCFLSLSFGKSRNITLLYVFPHFIAETQLKSI